MASQRFMKSIQSEVERHEKQIAAYNEKIGALQKKVVALMAERDRLKEVLAV